jgi:hypothetical protein
MVANSVILTFRPLATPPHCNNEMIYIIVPYVHIPLALFSSSPRPD